MNSAAQFGQRGLMLPMVLFRGIIFIVWWFLMFYVGFFSTLFVGIYLNVFDNYCKLDIYF